MNISDFRNLFRDGQSPHCILRVLITSCRVNSTNLLYQCYISHMAAAYQVAVVWVTQRWICMIEAIGHVSEEQNRLAARVGKGFADVRSLSGWTASPCEPPDAEYRPFRPLV